jgi:hypothetical protein
MTQSTSKSTYKALFFETRCMFTYSLIKGIYLPYLKPSITHPI